MTNAGRAQYRVTDQLFLWLLTARDQPVAIGELNMVRSMRGVSLRYADSWIERGFALSEDLPLIAEELFPTVKDTAAGAVDDARPDRWGERVIKFLDKPPRLSLLEYLYFAGDDRFGVLGVSTSNEAYQPRRLGPLPKLADTAAIQVLVRKVLANEPIPDHEAHGQLFARKCRELHDLDHGYRRDSMASAAAASTRTTPLSSASAATRPGVMRCAVRWAPAAAARGSGPWAGSRTAASRAWMPRASS